MHYLDYALPRLSPISYSVCSAAMCIFTFLCCCTHGTNFDILNSFVAGLQKEVLRYKNVTFDAGSLTKAAAMKLYLDNTRGIRLEQLRMLRHHLRIPVDVVVDLTRVQAQILIEKLKVARQDGKLNDLPPVTDNDDDIEFLSSTSPAVIRVAPSDSTSAKRVAPSDSTSAKRAAPADFLPQGIEKSPPAKRRLNP